MCSAFKIVRLSVIAQFIPCCKLLLFIPKCRSKRVSDSLKILHKWKDKLEMIWSLSFCLSDTMDLSWGISSPTDIFTLIAVSCMLFLLQRLWHWPLELKADNWLKMASLLVWPRHPLRKTYLTGISAFNVVFLLVFIYESQFIHDWCQNW